MKTTYKGILAFIKMLLITSLIIFVASCGSDNKVRSSQTSSSGTSGTSGTNETGSDGYDGNGTVATNNGISDEIQSEIAKMKSDLSCWYQDGSRLEFSFTGDSSLIYSATNLRGYASSGEKSGTVLATFVGVSYYNDIIVVTKLDDNKFNFYMSMCPYGSIILSGRPYGNQMYVDITVDYDTYSDLGSIDGAYTEFTASAWSNGGVNYTEKPVKTKFGPLNIQ
jgi:hypothetical protein